MINEITISGIVTKVWDMTHNVVLVSMQCNKDTFYAYWLKNEFELASIVDSYLIIKGNLCNVWVRKDNGEKTRITAICAKGVEKYDF